MWTIYTVLSVLEGEGTHCNDLPKGAHHEWTWDRLGKRRRFSKKGYRLWWYWPNRHFTFCWEQRAPDGKKDTGVRTQSRCVFGKGPCSSCKCHLGGPHSPQWQMVPLPRSQYSGDRPRVPQSRDTAQSAATRNTSSATFFPSISPPEETQTTEDRLLIAPSLCINHSYCSKR